MKIKKVNRYYCEYCKKSGCSAYHIQKHEKSCTVNPGRICNMCEIMGNGKHDLNILKDLLPDTKDYFLIYGWAHYTETCGGGEQIFNPYFKEDLERAMVTLKREAENCPMCILSALKQKNISCWVAGFEYTNELKSVWIDINNSDRE